MMDRRLEAMYCDDIRVEMGNKHSLIGVYHGDVIIDSLPASLSKLCVWVTVVTDAGHPFEKLRISLVQGEEENTLYEANADDLPKNLEGPSEEVAVGIIALPNFYVEKETFLCVIVETESEVLRGRRLRIRKKQDKSPPRLE
jgi:hypothetical protein